VKTSFTQHKATNPATNIAAAPAAKPSQNIGYRFAFSRRFAAVERLLRNG
jgi:hypothetical protein